MVPNGYLSKTERTQVLTLHAIALHLDRLGDEWQKCGRPKKWIRQARCARTYLQHIADEIMAAGDLDQPAIIKMAKECRGFKLQVMDGGMK